MEVWTRKKLFVFFGWHDCISERERKKDRIKNLKALPNLFKGRFWNVSHSVKHLKCVKYNFNANRKGFFGRKENHYVFITTEEKEKYKSSRICIRKPTLKKILSN